MTSRPPSWFDRVRRTSKRNHEQYRSKTFQAQKMALLGDVTYSNAKINGKLRRVLVWKP